MLLQSRSHLLCSLDLSTLKSRLVLGFYCMFGKVFICQKTSKLPRGNLLLSLRVSLLTRSADHGISLCFLSAGRQETKKTDGSEQGLLCECGRNSSEVSAKPGEASFLLMLCISRTSFCQHVQPVLDSSIASVRLLTSTTDQRALGRCSAFSRKYLMGSRQGRVCGRFLPGCCVQPAT
jgi:hypothetical protein